MSTIITIQATDLISDSRADINTNFSNLNTDKIEIGGVNGTPARGDIIVGKNASPTWEKLTIGAANTILVSYGTEVSWSAAATIGTSLTVPLVIGGTGTTSTLSLRSTSGVGAAGADIIFQVGNNGATEAMRILNSGNVGIGTTGPAANLEITGNAVISRAAIDTTDLAARTIIFGPRFNDASNVTVGFQQSATAKAAMNLGTSGYLSFDVFNGSSWPSTPGLVLGTNNYVAIGSNITPVSQLHVTDTIAGADRGITIQESAGNNTAAPILLGRKSRGTPASPTVISSGDGLLQLQARGYDGTGYIDAAAIALESDGTPGTNDMPGRIVFNTTADGASVFTEKMRITSTGNVGIGDTSPASLFTVGSGDLFQVNSTGQIGSQQAPVSDYLFALAGTTGNDHSRIIDITQADDAAEDTTVLNIANTANFGVLNTGTRNIKNGYLSLSPTGTVRNTSGTTLYNAYGTDQLLSVSNLTFGVVDVSTVVSKLHVDNVAISGTATINDSSGGIHDISISGYNADISATFLLLAPNFNSATINAYGGRFANAYTFPGDG